VPYRTSGSNAKMFPVGACQEEWRDHPPGLFSSSGELGEDMIWVGLVFVAGWRCGMVTSLPAGPSGMVVAWGGFLHRPELFSGRSREGVSRGASGLGDGELGGLASSSMSVSGTCISVAIGSRACGSVLVRKEFARRGAAI
jgi:hypothetical protein